MSRRASKPPATLPRSRLDEVLRAGIDYLRDQGAETSTVVVPTNPAMILPTPMVQPPVPLAPKDLPGFLQPRETYAPRVWDVLPKQFAETDQYGNELTFHRGEGGTATLERMVLGPDSGFPGATIEFTGEADKEFPTSWQWTNPGAASVWVGAYKKDTPTEYFAEHSIIEFGGTSRNNFFVERASLGHGAMMKLGGEMDKLGVKLPFKHGIEFENALVLDALDLITALGQLPQKFHVVYESGKFALHATCFDATFIVPAEKGEIQKEFLTVLWPGEKVHAYRKLENGDIVFDPFRSQGPPPTKKTFTYEDLYTDRASADPGSDPGSDRDSDRDSNLNILQTAHDSVVWGLAACSMLILCLSKPRNERDAKEYREACPFFLAFFLSLPFETLNR